MCLGGGGSAAPTWTPPKPRVIPPGPESPQDTVNDQVVENINDRSKQQEYRNKNRGDTASKQSQSGSKSNQAY